MRIKSEFPGGLRSAYALLARACRRLAVVVVGALLLPGLAAAQGAPTLNYLPFDPSFAPRIVVSWVDGVTFDGETTASPNAQAEFWGEFPDFTTEPPWSSTFYVARRHAEDARVLRLELLEHANVRPTARWVNDTLLYVNVWWGRIAGSDLILDVASGEFVYRAMFFWNLGDATTGSPGPDETFDEVLPQFVLRLEHSQGAPPPLVSSVTVTSADGPPGDEVRQVEAVTLPPMITNCFLEASDAEILETYALLRAFLDEQAAGLPPRPPETVCRNCTLYTLSWQLESGEAGSFAFSEQRPLRYLALDGLLPLIERLLARMTVEGSCAA